MARRAWRNAAKAFRQTGRIAAKAFRQTGRNAARAFRQAGLAAVLITLAAVPLAADARSDAKKHVEFGIDVAQLGLWREAIFQWERAVKIDPTYASAYNNLAIAYEHEGELEKARTAYEKALELEPNNALIKQNYELFREINDRTSRQDQ